MTQFELADLQPASTAPDLTQYGIVDASEIVYNPSYEFLYEEEMSLGLKGFERGKLTESGAVAVDTGIFTGRSPKDKYLVRDDTTRNTVWWSDQGKNDNKPISKEIWGNLKSLVTNRLSGKRLYVMDTICGANEDSHLNVRFIMEVAWQAHFVKNMFGIKITGAHQGSVPDGAQDRRAERAQERDRAETQCAPRIPV